MKNHRKSLIVIPVLLFVLACQAVTRPIEQVQDTAGTAAAFATQAGELVTQVSGVATNISPLGTLIPDPSAIPDFPYGDILDPKSTPLSEWNDIPVMPGAIAGDESEGVYGYKIAATSQEVKDYYAAQLPPLGWAEEFAMPMADTAILLYLKGEQALTITIMPGENGELIVLLTIG